MAMVDVSKGLGEARQISGREFSMAAGTGGKLTVDDNEYWETLYKVGKTPWELNTYAPPLKTFLDSPYAVAPGTIAVLGCGTGYDALLFAQYGFTVIAIDFAPSAIKATSEKFQSAGILGKSGFLLERDVFSLHEYAESFDYVLEHTCFCAIDPSRRNRYAYAVRDLLKPTGKLIALWWVFDRKGGGGPPFAANKNEIYDNFSRFFNLDIAHVPKDSVEERKNTELFTLMSKRSDV
jgi:methyl halide transferase